MIAASFVHLHTHSAYSLSEGAIKADALPALARADGQPAVALTDSGNLCARACSRSWGAGCDLLAHRLTSAPATGAA